MRPATPALPNVNPSLRNLSALVLLIFAGTALTVGSYLASKRPIPGPVTGAPEAQCLQSTQDACELQPQATGPGEADRARTS